MKRLTCPLNQRAFEPIPETEAEYQQIGYDKERHWFTGKRKNMHRWVSCFGIEDRGVGDNSIDDILVSTFHPTPAMLDLLLQVTNATYLSFFLKTADVGDITLYNTSIPSYLSSSHQTLTNYLHQKSDGFYYPMISEKQRLESDLVNLEVRKNELVFYPNTDLFQLAEPEIQQLIADINEFITDLPKIIPIAPKLLVSHFIPVGNPEGPTQYAEFIRQHPEFKEEYSPCPETVITADLRRQLEEKALGQHMLMRFIQTHPELNIQAHLTPIQCATRINNQGDFGYLLNSDIIFHIKEK